jgi:hypothetical protein
MFSWLHPHIPMIPQKKLRKNINSCGWLYIHIYICIYIYMWISPISSHSNPMIMIGNSTQLVLHHGRIYIYIYIIPLYSDKNSQRYIKITWNPYWLLLQSNPHALTPAAPQPRWPPLRRLAAARAWPGHSQGKFCYNLGTSIPIFENVQMCMYLYIHIYRYIDIKYRYNI